MSQIEKLNMTIDPGVISAANLECSCGNKWDHVVGIVRTNQPIIFECPVCHAMAKFELFKPFITPYTPA